VAEQAKTECRYTNGRLNQLKKQRTKIRLSGPSRFSLYFLGNNLTEKTPCVSN